LLRMTGQPLLNPSILPSSLNRFYAYDHGLAPV
jgi:hypothetical protein